MVVTVLLLGLIGSLNAQQPKVVHFKELQKYLPTMQVPSFERKKPTGQTQSAMGFTTSEAKVRYVKASQTSGEETVEGEKSIEITITDMSLMPMMTWALGFQQGDFENETEDGYEKSVTIKKTYKGRASANTGEYKNCEVQFAVGNRFMVALKGEGLDDTALLIKLAESMNLEGLEKAKSE
jgi:hypothetical protein